MYFAYIFLIYLFFFFYFSLTRHHATFVR